MCGGGGVGGWGCGDAGGAEGCGGGCIKGWVSLEVDSVTDKTFLVFLPFSSSPLRIVATQFPPVVH